MLLADPRVRLLLAAPGREVAATELVGGPEALALAAREAHDALLDDRAKAAYRRRVRELQAELDDADEAGDAERSERARGELDVLLDELRRAVGLAGRDRPTGATAERARVTARKAIASTLQRIAEHEPELGRLLRTAVRTGLFCSYEPPPLAPIEWELG